MLRIVTKRIWSFFNSVEVDLMTVIGMINSYNKLIIIYCLLIYTDQLNSWVIIFIIGASVFVL